MSEKSIGNFSRRISKIFKATSLICGWARLAVLSFKKCLHSRKFAVMKLRTWKSVEFNYTFDAVVYAVSASLGFAALENVMYVFSGGFGVALMRALTSIPGHAVFGVFMGLHYGLARRAAAFGNEKAANRELRLAYLIPVLLHGFYDFCLSVNGWIWTLIFFVFYIGLVIAAFIKVKKFAAEDTPVEPGGWHF